MTIISIAFEYNTSTNFFSKKQATYTAIKVSVMLLIVDDNSEIRESLTEYLEKNGLSCETAETKKGL